MLSAARLNLALFLARVPLGAYFAIAGYDKIFGPGGLNGFVDHSIGMVPSGVPADFGRYFLTALPFVELASGLFLIVGLLVRTFAFLQSLLLISFIIAMKRGFNIVHLPHSTGDGTPFDNNIVFLGLTLCLTLLGSGEWHARRVFRRTARRGDVIVEDEPLVATTARGTPLL